MALGKRLKVCWLFLRGLCINKQERRERQRNKLHPRAWARGKPYNFGVESILPRKGKAPTRKFRGNRQRRRQRRLTLTSDDPIAQSTAIQVQSGSTLLQKLPREIRDTIWKEAVGSRTFHLWYYKDKFGHSTLLHPARLWPNARDWHWDIDGEFRMSCQNQLRPGWHQSPREEILGLIMTCRMIYSETINYLYSENTFDLYSPQFLTSLPGPFLPQRLNKITSLRVLWRMSDYNEEHRQEDYKLLQDLFGLVAGMEGLKVLSLDLGCDLGLFLEENCEVAQWISRVTRPDVFEVTLPARTEARPDELTFKDLPCTIFRSPPLPPLVACCFGTGF